MFSEVYNNTLSQIIQKKGNFFVSGQNVDVGSHISGLSGFLKTLKNNKEGRMLNSLRKKKKKKKTKVSKKFRENYNFKNKIKIFYEKISKL